MENKTKWIIGLSVASIVGALGYLWYKNKKDDEEVAPTGSTSSGTKLVVTAPVIKQGSTPTMPIKTATGSYKSIGNNSFKVMGIKDGKYVETGRTIPFVNGQAVGVKKGETPSGFYLQSFLGDIVWASKTSVKQ